MRYQRKPKITIPELHIPGGLPLAIMRVDEFQADDLRQPHRNAFCMWLWTTCGRGFYLIDHQRIELTANTILFIRANQLHQVIIDPEDGWLVLFNEGLLLEFLRLNPEQNGQGIFADFIQGTLIRTDKPAETLFQSLLPLLKSNPACLRANLSALLCNTNRLAGNATSSSFDREALRKLKILISQHFRSEREAPFYSLILGIPPKRLNRLCRQATGKLVQELISAYLLAECERLLSGDLPLKTIAAELNFSSPAHFSAFFRKGKSETPKAYRARLRYGSSNLPAAGIP